MTRIDYKKRLEDALSKIEWKLRHAGCDHYYIVNHKGESSGWTLYNNTIENKDNDTNANAYFNLKYSKITILNNNCVCVGTKALFILFSNYYLKK